VGESDLENLIPEYKYRVFVPNFCLTDGRLFGVTLASRHPIEGEERFYCDGGDSSNIPLLGLGTHRPAVAGAWVAGYQIYATHFTWTPQMSETEKQHDHLDRLLTRLGGRELVLCGDFNIPRGNGAYQKLATKYKDNVPAEIVTTIDYELHRAKREGRSKFEVVVDYIWSTPGYEVSDVRIVSGISDHCALVAELKIK